MNCGSGPDNFFSDSNHLPISDAQSKNTHLNAHNLYANSLQSTENLGHFHLTAPLTSSESTPDVNRANDFGSYFADSFQSQAVLHPGYSNAFNGVYEQENQPSTTRVPAAADTPNSVQATNYYSPFRFDTNHISHPASYNTGTPWLNPGFNFPLNYPPAGVMIHPLPPATKSSTLRPHLRMPAYPTPMATPESSSSLPLPQDASAASRLARFQGSVNIADPTFTPNEFDGLSGASAWVARGSNHSYRDTSSNHATLSAACHDTSYDQSVHAAPPTSVEEPFVSSQALPLTHYSTYSSMNGDKTTLPSNQPTPQHMRDIPSSVGPHRATRNKEGVAPARQRKPYRKEKRTRMKPAEDEAFDACKVLAPPSPTISVKVVPVSVQPADLPKLRDSRGGSSPSEDTQIIVNGPAKHVPFKKMRPVAAKDGDQCRCRWDGCRYVVPATKHHILAHMRVVHNLRGTGQIRCRWHPPIRVQMPGEAKPILVTSHSEAYCCNVLLQRTSVFNHIDSHFNHEQQPNPNVIQCDRCKGDMVQRGGHKCVARGRDREGGEEEEEEGEEGKEWNEVEFRKNSGQKGKHNKRE